MVPTVLIIDLKTTPLERERARETKRERERERERERRKKRQTEKGSEREDMLPYPVIYLAATCMRRDKPLFP